MDDRLRAVEIAAGLLAQRVEDHERDFIQFAPLVLEVGQLRWTLEKMQKDLSNAHDAIRDLGDQLDKEHDERVEGQAERKQELEAAQAARTAELAQIQEARALQDKELKSRLHLATISLIGVFLTALAAVLVPILTGGG